MLLAMTPDAAQPGSDAWRRQRCRPRSDVTVTDLGDQLVLLDPSNQEMYALDDVGRFIWESLPNHTLEGVARAMGERYGLDPSTARNDLHGFVLELREADLVHDADPLGESGDARGESESEASEPDATKPPP